MQFDACDGELAVTILFKAPDLVKLIERKARNIVYSDFEDEIGPGEEEEDETALTIASRLFVVH